MSKCPHLLTFENSSRHIFLNSLHIGVLRKILCLQQIFGSFSIYGCYVSFFKNFERTSIYRRSLIYKICNIFKIPKFFWKYLTYGSVEGRTTLKKFFTTEKICERSYICTVTLSLVTFYNYRSPIK